jgi:hypothetical protein
MITILVAGLVWSLPTGTSAQSKTIPGEHRTVTATVQSVDLSARRVVLRTPSGELRSVRVPNEATRLTDVKPGETVTVTYYDNMVLRAKAPEEPDVDTRTSAVTPGHGARPGGTTGTQQTLTVLIDEIDRDVPSVSFKGPRGWSYQTKVLDRAALENFHVGDRVDIVWTEATLVSVTPSAK